MKYIDKKLKEFDEIFKHEFHSVKMRNFLTQTIKETQDRCIEEIEKALPKKEKLIFRDIHPTNTQTSYKSRLSNLEKMGRNEVISLIKKAIKQIKENK